MYIYEGTNNFVSGAFLKCFRIYIPFSNIYSVKNIVTRICQFNKVFLIFYYVEKNYRCFLVLV